MSEGHHGYKYKMLLKKICVWSTFQHFKYFQKIKWLKKIENYKQNIVSARAINGVKTIEVRGRKELV